MPACRFLWLMIVRDRISGQIWAAVAAHLYDMVLYNHIDNLGECQLHQCVMSMCSRTHNLCACVQNM